MKHLIVIFAGFFAFNLNAQTDTSYWKKGGAININFSQVALYNWAAGGESSLAGNSLVSLYANYKKDKSIWDNNILLGYGLLQSGESDIIKNDDKIDLTSKYGYKGGPKWYYSFLLNFKSQFAPGYNFPNDSDIVSEFMSPGYLLLAAGIDYKPNDNFSLFVSPLTGKFTFVLNEKLANAGAYGVDPAAYDSTGQLITKGDNLRKELGAYVALKYTRKLMENVDFATKLELFSNYLNNPGNIDVNWDVLLAMKVNKFITASITTTLIYDHDIDIPTYKTINGEQTVIGFGPKTQFREVLAIGFSYTF